MALLTIKGLPVTVATIVVAGIALSACGSSAPTKHDVVARADAICSTALGKARALEAGTADYYSQLAKIVTTEAKQLGALPRPATDRAVLELFVDSMARADLQYRELATAERDGNQALISRLTAQLAASPAAGYAASYGLRECAGKSGTLVSG